MSEDRSMLHATAYLVLVCVSRASLAKRPLPKELVSGLERYTMSPEQARASLMGQE
jgi:acyl-CoA thioesterase FadM